MTDDDLHVELRRADPAASLAPIAPETVTRLLENAMATTGANPPTTRPAIRPAIRPWLLAAAAVLVLLAVSTTVLRIGGNHGRTPDSVAAPTAAPSQPPNTRQPTGGPSTTRISGGNDDGTARCMAPDAGELAARAHLAFEGTVLRVEAGVVTLQVKHLWAGTRTELVEVTQTDGNTAALLAGVVLKPGATYLIAATADGQIMHCGYSGPTDSQLRALYDTAFA